MSLPPATASAPVKLTVGGAQATLPPPAVPPPEAPAVPLPALPGAPPLLGLPAAALFAPPTGKLPLPALLPLGEPPLAGAPPTFVAPPALERPAAPPPEFAEP